SQLSGLNVLSGLKNHICIFIQTPRCNITSSNSSRRNDIKYMHGTYKELEISK
ncbi:MAG: hypothetical protein EZS28_044100, partial [Streblomastix strix]